MSWKFPLVIETSNGGLHVSSADDLRRIARSRTRLSPGYIHASTVQDLLTLVCKAVGGEITR